MHKRAYARYLLCSITSVDLSTFQRILVHSNTEFDTVTYYVLRIEFKVVFVLRLCTSLIADQESKALSVIQLAK